MLTISPGRVAKPGQPGRFSRSEERTPIGLGFSPGEFRSGP